MKLNASYEVRDGYLYVKAMGEFVPSTAQETLYELVEKASSHALNRILCDITLVTGLDAQQTATMTRFDTSLLVVKSFPKNFRLAVLETVQQLDIFDENVMVNRGTIVKVTSDLNEALEWLGVT